MHGTCLRFLLLGAVFLFVPASWATAQIPAEPDLGYVFPAGGRAGSTVAVRLGIYDWTPDLQFFVLHSRARLEVLGPATPLLMAGPPHFLDQKAFNPLPLPREVPARFVLPADLPPGPLRWQIANANGISKAGMFVVGSGPEVVEDEQRTGAQQLASLPITVSGRLLRNEEVDRYCFRASRDGPVTCAVTARRLGADFNGVVEVRDKAGRLLADAADTQGEDPVVTFPAGAGQDYTVSVRDLDFRGHRSYVYRLEITPGARILASLPAAGRRGTTQPIELIGLGVATGATRIERVTRDVSFPRLVGVDSLAYRLETPFGTAAAFCLPITDLPESINPVQERNGPHRLEVPAAVTGTLDQRSGANRYRLTGKKGDVWNIAVEARRHGSSLDVTLTVLGPDGKELAKNDDLPGTTDAGLLFTLPKDGNYELLIRDQSGKSGSPTATYRLIVEHPVQDFALEVPQRLNVPIGTKAELPVKAIRRGNFNGPIALELQGLPAGISTPTKLVLAAGQTELKVPLQSAADAPALASVVTVRGTAVLGGKTIARTALAPAGGSLAPRTPEENLVSSILIASTMKPRIKIRPAESDKRTVHSGSTHLAEVVLERLEGYGGEITVQMESKQPSKFRQGVLGPDVWVPPGADRVLYPCFVPEGREASDCYRTALLAMVRVPDPRGKVRYLASRMHHDVTIGLTIEGPILKVVANALELTARPGLSFEVPVKVFRSAKLSGPVRLELRPPESLAGLVTTEPVSLAPEKAEVTLRAITASDRRLAGKHVFTVRAIGLQRAALPALCETAKSTPMQRDVLDYLKTGCLPVVSETSVPVEFTRSDR